MTFCRTCCTLAIDNMNVADSRGSGKKRRRINKKDHEARVRETPEEREVRLARRRQRDRTRRELAQAQETPEQREARLAKRREQYRARLSRNLCDLLALSLQLPRCAHPT